MGSRGRTKGLNIVLVEATLYVFNHQTCLANLRVPDHADFDDDAARKAWIKCPVNELNEKAKHLFFSSAASRLWPAAAAEVDA